MNRTVCHISSVHPTFDSRIFQKECRSLAKHGFHTHLVIQHTHDEVVDGVHIHALKKYESRWKRMLFGPWGAFRVAYSVKAKLYHFHDPELLPVGVLLAILGKKVIYDAHENLGEQIRSKPWARPNILRRFIAFSATFFEHVCALFFSRVVGVIPEIANRFGKKGVVLRNVPVIDVALNAKPKNIAKNRPAIIFVGGIFRIKGITDLIEAVGKLDGRVELWLLGRWESDAFKKECEGMSGYQHTKFLGLVSPDEVYEFIQAADIGACTFRPVPNYLQSFPIKIFEYLASGKPVIASDFPYWQKNFKEGVKFVAPESAESIAKGIEELLQTDLIQLGAEGKAMVQRDFSWSTDEAVLVETYNTLLNG